ncbi:hypothetical protein LSTR_LSTR001537 [Laodelphax striatellus]|uniref:HAT C-terminal dimerisation domain-containing protein n=1 Tax=Laodelphax striatellus TaxID=195883 RepID=A0A482XBZ3_LAOST|nr:hypothetical protein LSTR_LSTR001537 [Laodelphax striatellus]
MSAAIPRFKKLYFKDPPSLAKVINSISKSIREIQSTTSNQTGSPHSSPPSDSDTSISGTSLFQMHNKNIQKAWPKGITQISEADSNISEELALYLRAPAERIEQNPILYWKQMAGTFPIVSSIALRFVPTIATSVPSERLFSEAGQILRNHRSRLTSDLANKLLFLKDVSDKYWN